MLKKPTLAQIFERLIYLLAVILVPSIPLFFLYSRNAAQGLLFKHFLITGGVLAAVSLTIYLLVSKLLLKRRRTMIIIASFWAVFWFCSPVTRIVRTVSPLFWRKKAAVLLLLIIIIIAFILSRIKINRLAANTVAVLLCLMFIFNFVPPALAVHAGKAQRIVNEKTGKLPYEIKTEFNIDPTLPHPNVYWLHMDGMMGFDAIERYFNDSQTELKNELAQRGFIINRDARLEAGYTNIAVPAMTSPSFYDSYLADEFTRVAKLTRGLRQNSLSASMTEKGFSLNTDIYPKIEILKAFSDAGYINIGNPNLSHVPIKIDIETDETNIIEYSDSWRKASSAFNTLAEFKNLITDTGALSVIKPIIDKMFERKRPAADTQSIPAYRETVDKYATGIHSGSGIVAQRNIPTQDYMVNVVKAMKHATSTQTPHFVYFINYTAHTISLGTVINEVNYEKPVGTTYFLDENGNYYKERLDDPLSVQLYLPQHKYTVKQMIAQIDIIIENDPDAVIILQGDHGIHGHGYNNSHDFESMFIRGYNLEDILNLNLHVMSAVRIPEQYGKLSQPLDPLDIARYLVNNFVGKGNYDYLHYTEGN